MDDIISRAGFNSIADFSVKVALPLLIVTLILFFGTLLLPIPFFFPYLVLAFGIGSIFLVPTIIGERKKTEINESIHMFITYAGTISTIDLDRKTFFTKIAENKDYGQISYIFEKILYFAKKWNLGFATSCRKLMKFSSSKIFSDFLDRFAAALDFGQNLETFMRDEQDAVMEDYTTIYKQALNNIGMIREAFIAITISVAFGMSTALLLPLLMGISILVAIQWSLFILFLIDVFLLVFISMFIPSDNLCHNLKDKDEGTMKIYYSFAIALPICAIIGVITFSIEQLNFLFKLSIALTPLLVVGYYAMKEENMIFKRDKEFPAFIRALGATIYARQGGILSSLEALQVHNFGVMQDIVNNLYKRLKIGSDKLRSWYYFAAESGSNMISKYTNIFADSIYLGGHAEKISEIISVNFNKMLSLRKLRFQQAASLKGALYGSMVGFIATLYISISITKLLTGMFSQAWSEDVAGSSMGSMVASIIPMAPEVDEGVLSMFVGLIIILHSFISALIIKIVEGGNRFAMIFDFLAMMWIGTIMSWVVPLLSYKLFAGPMGVA
jgi:archaeal flagellar protein FlaJ